MTREKGWHHPPDGFMAEGDGGDRGFGRQRGWSAGRYRGSAGGYASAGVSGRQRRIPTPEPVVHGGGRVKGRIPMRANETGDEAAEER
eukprot:611437-Prymnesium_polylepis.1